MANYSVADLKALREKTGAGMLDVKKALEEAEGDPAKAEEIIRVKGLKGIGKREGRAASDGLVAATVVPLASGDGEVGVLVEINSETDFVAKSGPFLALADRVLAAAVASGAADAEALVAADSDGITVQAAVDEVQATLGEKIVVRRVARVAGEHVDVYLHKVNKDLQTVLAMPDVQQQLLGQGAVAAGGTQADFARLIADDRRKYARIIVENKLTAD